MSTDRELLEAAARAAGLHINAARQAERDAEGFGHVGLWISGVQTAWNPLADSAAALELAVKLDITIYPGQHKPCVMWWRRPGLFEQEGLGEANGDDRMATVRRLIVRAAAALGSGG